MWADVMIMYNLCKSGEADYYQGSVSAAVNKV